MKHNFEPSFEAVIGHEGGLSLDREDRGNWTSGKIGVGKLNGTKYGVSAMAYPDLDIRNLTLQDAKDIYRRDYWNKARCDDLPPGLDYLTFDSGINHGVSRAGRFLQTAVGAKVDGQIGPATVARASAVFDLSKAVSEFCVTRGLFYTEIETFQRYKLGWFRRLFETHWIALELVADQADNPHYGNTLVIQENTPKAAVDTDLTDEERAFWLDLHRKASEAAERALKFAA